MSTTTAQVQFCQYSQDATEACKPIGSWFDALYLNRSNWEAVSDSHYERVNAMEDFITTKLCELHSLPPRRSDFTNDELAQLATPQQQASIWQAMLVEFGLAKDSTTDCIECGKPDGTPRYDNRCWRCELGRLVDKQ